MKKLTLLLSIVAAVALCHSALAIQINTLVTWNMADSGNTWATNSENIRGVAIEGETAYLAWDNGPQDMRITKITNLGGAQSYSELLSQATWAAAAGTIHCSPYYGMGLSGNCIQFGDSSSDCIWRCDKVSGGLSRYISREAITNCTGDLGWPPGLLTPKSVTPSGEHVFYEADSDSILISAGSNLVNYLVTDAQLTAAFGNDRVSGGMTYDSSGDLYWGNSTSDNLCKRSAAGVLSVALTTGDITNHTGEAATASFGAIYYAAGKVYFYETRSDSILKFQPSNPAGTLDTHVTEADLLAGPGASDNLCMLGWYGSHNMLTFALMTPDYRGVYEVVPEPAGIFGLAALCVVFRAVLRRK